MNDVKRGIQGFTVRLQREFYRIELYRIENYRIEAYRIEVYTIEVYTIEVYMIRVTEWDLHNLELQSENYRVTFT